MQTSQRNPLHPRPGNTTAAWRSWAARLGAPAVAAALLFLGVPPAAAADSSGGTVQGRIQNAGTGGYLKSARVNVVGTQLETFTNDYGEFTLSNVPPGARTLRVFYTGLDAQEIPVQVTAGQVTVQDVRMSSVSRYGDSEVVELDAFVIQADRETNAASIAANEQRFASNIKNVVAADAFGDVTEGNVGEFIKYLPGVTVDYVAADVRTISVRGFADNFTAVTVDGNRMASSASGNSIRSFELEQVSINNVSRIEVTKVPLPEMGADSLGGSVNMVSRSAFEQTKPSLKYKAYLSVNDEATKLFSKTPGPGEKETYKILPGFEVSYVNPVSDNFGFVINALSSNQFNEQHRSQTEWRFTGAGASVEDPYLRRYQLQDGPKNTYRDSISFKADWKIAENQVLTGSYQANYYHAFFGNRNITFDVGSNNAPSPSSGTPLDWGPTFSHGATGRGAVSMGGSWRDKLGGTHATSLNWKYDSRDWDIDAGLAYSTSKTWYRGTGRDHFTGYSLAMQGESRVLFDNIGEPRPGGFTVLDSTGNPLDPLSLDNYRLTTLQDNPVDGQDSFTTAKMNIERHFDTTVPFSLKGGVSIQRQRRDMRRTSSSWTYLGPDLIANNADNVATPFMDPRYSGQDPHWGFAPIEWVNPYEIYRYYQANPNQFQFIEVTSERNRINGSEVITEWITSAYLQARARFLENRLNVVGGFRYELTEDFGRGPLSVPDAGPATPTNIDELHAVLIERGFGAEKDYDGVYPSLHATFNITDDLIARFAYAKTLGRPDFSNIIPNTTINEDEEPGPDDPPGVINIRNTGLVPWSAQNLDLSMEYYPKHGGMLSAGVFRKDVSNFFGSDVRIATAADLAELGLPSQYLDWELRTTINAGDATVSGFELNLNQPLTPLGEWGRFFNVSANGTWLHLSGPNKDDFLRFIGRTGNVGISFNRKPVVILVKWNYRGEQRRGPNSAAPGGYEYYDSRANIDVNFEYQFSKRFTFFVNGRNITDVPQVLQRYNDDVPAYAQNYRRESFGVQWSIGLKGTF